MNYTDTELESLLKNAPDQVKSTTIINRLFSRTAKGIKFGLDKITRASAQLGNPHLAIPAIHVAGTNGKGSTCAYIERIVRSYGHITGLYTSPHIVDFEERFQINGKPVDTQAWLDVYADIEPIIEELDLTFFEATTLMAFEIFKRVGVTFAIYETGMGGRLDATNIIVPKATVITAIDYDHKEFLGNTIVKIASEKLGIVKSGVPCIMHWSQYADVLDCAGSFCYEHLAPLTKVKESDAQDIVDDGYARFVYKNVPCQLPMAGRYQVMNALGALIACEKAGFANVQQNVLALEETFLPGRFQVVPHKGKSWIFDVGHNPQASLVCTSQLAAQAHPQDLTVICGIMADKEFEPMLKNYAQVAGRIILTQPHIPRAATVDQLRSQVPVDYAGECIVAETVDGAIELALQSKFPAICVTGSFYTVGEAFQALGISPYLPHD